MRKEKMKEISSIVKNSEVSALNYQLAIKMGLFGKTHAEVVKNTNAYKNEREQFVNAELRRMDDCFEQIKNTRN